MRHEPRLQLLSTGQETPAAEHILSRRAGATIHVQAGQLNDIFTAHAWVSCQGIDMTGGAVAGLHSLDRPVPSL